MPQEIPKFSFTRSIFPGHNNFGAKVELGWSAPHSPCTLWKHEEGHTTHTDLFLKTLEPQEK